MKKKILMLIMAIAIVCLAGCGKEKTQVVPNVPETPNNIIDTEMESGEVSNEIGEVSGDELLDEITTAYKEPSIKPKIK